MAAIKYKDPVTGQVQVVGMPTGFYTNEEIDSKLADKAPAYTCGTEDLTAGVSALETGKLYFVYE